MLICKDFLYSYVTANFIKKYFLYPQCTRSVPGAMLDMRAAPRVEDAIQCTTKPGKNTSHVHKITSNLNLMLTLSSLLTKYNVNKITPNLT